MPATDTQHDRTARLRSLQSVERGYVWLAVCDACGHASGLPVGLLVRRFGELCPVRTALAPMRCAECGGERVSAKRAKLCEPGCGRQRG